MTQPPIRPSDDHATRRLVIFVSVFLLIVAIGSQSQSQTRLRNGEKESICVCLPSKAGLLLKSAIARAQTQTTSLLTIKAPITQK
jgi:hypothetical protein